MKENEKQKLIDEAKDFFRDNISKNHIKNTKKLTKLKEFNINPFLINYLANFLKGEATPQSLAKALIYPRVLGTSINTTFGTHFQKFCIEVLREYGFASTTQGIDIEFVDQIDKRKKYCQLKSGPNTINKEDVPTIINHFQGVRNLARTNHLQIGIDDLIVGVLYGTPKELSGHYKKIHKTNPVYIGKEFWTRLTGDEKFYSELIDSLGEVAIEADGTVLLKKTINELAKEIAISDIL